MPSDMSAQSVSLWQTNSDGVDDGWADGAAVGAVGAVEGEADSIIEGAWLGNTEGASLASSSE